MCEIPNDFARSLSASAGIALYSFSNSELIVFGISSSTLSSTTVTSTTSFTSFTSFTFYIVFNLSSYIVFSVSSSGPIFSFVRASEVSLRGTYFAYPAPL